MHLKMTYDCKCHAMEMSELGVQCHLKQQSPCPFQFNRMSFLASKLWSCLNDARTQDNERLSHDSSYDSLMDQLSICRHV